MKRILLLLSLVLLLVTGISSAAAQIPAPIDWIPASFTGFVRLDTSDAQLTLNDLNLALFVASVLQPARFQFTAAQDYDTFFPLNSFDMENGSFNRMVMPWLKDEVIVAYRALGAQFDASADETVLILPSRDAFTSATFLQQVVAGQDLLQRENYRDVIIYSGDKTAFAFMPTAVLVGADELIRETIDTMNGDGASLTADPVYQQVTAALPEASLISAYVSGETAGRALGVLLSGGNSADPFLNALSESLDGLNDDRSSERLLLSGALDGIGVSLHYDPIRSTNFEAHVVLHTVAEPDAGEAIFDPAVLDLIPRSAMLVQSGADAASAANGALYSLPFWNFANRALASFPVVAASDPASASLPTPTTEDIQAAVASFLEAVQPLVAVQDDLLGKLDGSYSLALLPRPNNPMPGLNTPFDLLLVVQTDSPESATAAQSSARTLLETFTAPLDDEELGSHMFQTLHAPDTGEVLVSVGAVGNLLVIGTGSATQQALDAQNGDNQLIQQERWQNLSQGEQIPYVYVDVNAFYNTFQPTIGGPAVRPVSQLGIQSRYLGDNLFELHLLVALS
ncbi:MAG: DUF3352 domain-containing protein [Chloroflexota bacterium]